MKHRMRIVRSTCFVAPVTRAGICVLVGARRRRTQKSVRRRCCRRGQEGKRLFLKIGCYSCHGHEAEGAVGPDLTDDEWIYKPTDSMIFNTIAKDGAEPSCRRFRDQLKPEEIWKIVEFLRDKNRQRHVNEGK